MAGVKLKMSTSAHPQTDGRAEVANKTVGQILRTVCEDDPLGWADALPTTEMAINIAEPASTGIAPFKVVHGSSEPATSTFTFDLPPHLAIHPRIHASKLRPHFPADSDRFPSLAFLNPPPVVRATDSPDAQWEVEKVVGDRLVRGRLKYKVQWLGYSAASDGWIDAEELRQDAPDVVNDHERAKADRRRDRPAGRKKKARARLSALLASLSLPTFRSGGDVFARIWL
ncbi:hypothetical protein JCM8115_005898 [Rhodotorula mucilaginosa]